MKRLDWARALIRLARFSPEYGTPAWEALPDGPEKVSSVVRAAENWFRDGEEFPVRLEAEMAALRTAHLDGENDAYRGRRDAHRASWDGKRGCFRPDPTLPARLEAEFAEWAGGGDE